jgi:hypothetical protein
VGSTLILVKLQLPDRQGHRGKSTWTNSRKHAASNALHSLIALYHKVIAKALYLRIKTREELSFEVILIIVERSAMDENLLY